MLKGMRPAAQQVGGDRGLLYQLAARPFWGLRPLVTALLLATMISAGVGHAAPRGAPSIIPASSSGVPVYNIQAACREMASIPEAHLIGSDGPDATKLCVNDENLAREQLLERWAKFKAADRAMCAGASRSGTVSPTYTELMTCLEMTHDNSGSEATGPRQRARPEPWKSAAVGVSSSSPVVVVPAQPMPRSIESAQQVSALDQPPTLTSEKEVDTGTQVADLKQTIESLRSDLANSARKIANLEKDKEDAERAAQAQQAQRDAESAKFQTEEAGVAKTIQPDAKNHGLVILVFTTLAGLAVLLAIGGSARRRRAVSTPPT